MGNHRRRVEREVLTPFSMPDKSLFVEVEARASKFPVPPFLDRFGVAERHAFPISEIILKGRIDSIGHGGDDWQE